MQPLIFKNQKYLLLEIYFADTLKSDTFSHLTFSLHFPLYILHFSLCTFHFSFFVLTKCHQRKPHMNDHYICLCPYYLLFISLCTRMNMVSLNIWYVISFLCFLPLSFLSLLSFHHFQISFTFPFIFYIPFHLLHSLSSFTFPFIFYSSSFILIF
jgi:hypothetical protein